MSWEPKDPWGRKGGDPLEDVLRQAQDQLRQLMPRRGLGTIILIVVAVVVVWQSVFIVAPAEEGVVKRFGEVTRTVGPGPHFKIPFLESVLTPRVQEVHRIEIGFRTDPRGRIQMLPREALMLTGDENIIGIQFIVQYRIKEAKDFLFNVDDVQSTIGNAAEASMREIIGKSRIDEVLTVGKAEIQQGTMDLLQGILDSYDAGVSIQAVQLQNVDPPQEVAAAFKDVASAKEDKQKLINQSQSYRNDIIPRAKGQAAKIVNEAKGYGQARVERAKGDANRFEAILKEYRQGKDVITKRIYIETMEEIMPNVEKIIVDKKVGERILPYLPLDRASKSGRANKPGE